MPLTELK